jgi:hypothetical protein
MDVDVFPNGIVFSAADTTKWQTVRADLRRMGQKIPTNIQLNVQLRQHTEDTPASTQITQRPPLGWEIELNLQNWYVEMSSVGELVGMIAHELGVHSLTDIELGAAELRKEKKASAGGSTVDIGTQKLKLKAWKAGDPRTLDHVNAAKFGKQGPSARMKQYTLTMLRLGDAIQKRLGVDAAAQAAAPAAARVAALAAQRDLLDTFLFDIARMMATDDGKALAIFLQTGPIADVFNWYKAEVLTRYADRHKWLNAAAAAGPKTSGELKSMLLAKAEAALYRQRRYLKAVGVTAARAAWGVASLIGSAISTVYGSSG